MGEEEPVNDQVETAGTNDRKNIVKPNEKCVDFIHNNACIKKFRDEGEDEVKADKSANDRQLWAGACTFIMAAIGSAIGLGNFWKFPYLCYKWGGGTFFIPYLISLFVLGLPMMLLELGLGQLFQRGDIGVFRGITPRFYGVGLASVFSAFAINTFYTYLIGISAAYFFASFQTVMPWSVQHSKAWQDVHCTASDTPMYKSHPEQPCPALQKCDPDDMYVTEEWLQLELVHSYVYVDEEGSGSCEPFNTKDFPAGSEGQDAVFSGYLALALLLCWAVSFFCVWKGVKSSSYVVWVTVPGPILFIFIMVLNGLCLPNADEGIRMYLKGEIDGAAPDLNEKLNNGQMWAEAIGQIFFSLGVCMGVMTSYASYNHRQKPIIRDVLVISFGNCLLSFFAGFAVFSIIGYLKWLGSPVAKKTSSIGLAFIAYPAAAEALPASNFWCLLLGATLFCLGIDTAFSLVEAISTVIADTATGRHMPRKLVALIICIVGWAWSLLFCSSWGYTYVDIADSYISTYLMFILGIGQCAGAAWVFDEVNFRANKEAESDEKDLQIATATSNMINTISYWSMAMIMGPITIWVFKPLDLVYVGIIIFWVSQIITWVVAYLMLGKKKGTEKVTFVEFYEKVWLRGIHDLAMMHVLRSKGEARPSKKNLQKKTWHYVYCFWWSVSVKYIMVWALWTVMMWRMEGDISGGGYSGFHPVWQAMGLVYPGIGLLCMFIPCCLCTQKTAEDEKINFEEEERVKSRSLGQTEEDFKEKNNK